MSFNLDNRQFSSTKIRLKAQPVVRKIKDSVNNATNRGNSIYFLPHYQIQQHSQKVKVDFSLQVISFNGG